MLCKNDEKTMLLDVEKHPINQNGELEELIRQRGTELLKVWACQFSPINLCLCSILKKKEEGLSGRVEPSLLL